jgi:hypothetical protein
VVPTSSDPVPGVDKHKLCSNLFFDRSVRLPRPHPHGCSRFLVQASIVEEKKKEERGKKRKKNTNKARIILESNYHKKKNKP